MRRITTKDRQAVALLKASGLSDRAIARQTGHARQTVTAILASEDVNRLRTLARDTLDRSMPDISEQFLEAIRVGAAKGSGDSAYRALLSLGVISRPDDTSAGPRTIVNIGQIVMDRNAPAAVVIEHADLPVVEVEKEPPR